MIAALLADPELSREYVANGNLVRRHAFGAFGEGASTSTVPDLAPTFVQVHPRALAFVFPSLGPTAFLLFYTPRAPAASPKTWWSRT